MSINAERMRGERGRFKFATLRIQSPPISAPYVLIRPYNWHSAPILSHFRSRYPRLLNNKVQKRVCKFWPWFVICGSRLPEEVPYHIPLLNRGAAASKSAAAAARLPNAESTSRRKGIKSEKQIRRGSFSVHVRQNQTSPLKSRFPLFVLKSCAFLGHLFWLNLGVAISPNFSQIDLQTAKDERRFWCNLQRQNMET